MSGVPTEATVKRWRATKKGKALRYIRRTPLPWVTKACGLSGTAVRVGQALWYLAGVTKTRSRLRLGSKLLENDFACPASSARRGLKQLEDAGLVKVERRRGRCPMVTILDVVVGEA